MSTTELLETLEKARDELNDAMGCLGRGDLRGAAVRAEAAQYLAGDVASALESTLAAANPLRYCATCDQRRRGAASDPRVCSHCRTAFPTPESEE